MMIEIDHLVLTAPTLTEGQDYVAAHLGARPVFRGRHPQLGTETALLGLGAKTYLEVIAIAAEARRDTRRFPFNLDRCTKPRLTSWCARTEHFSDISGRLRDFGIDLGHMRDGQRETPDGDLVTWAFSDIYDERLDGTVPFFIRWNDIHPCDTLPKAGQLRALYLQHPDPGALHAIFKHPQPDIIIERAPAPKLQAKIRLATGVDVWLS